MKKFKKPELKSPANRVLRRGAPPEERVTDALKAVPRITNDTVAEHREEVLGSARKYIYPLQHSKHSIVRISISLFVVVLVAFLAYTGLALYKLQATGGFIYDVTRVLPFPVAKAGHSWVSYESYLFELRRNMHYYHTQQQADFSSKSGKDQLALLKKQALDKVIQDAYVKQLAKKDHVSVSNQAVQEQVQLVRTQNRLGNNDRQFRSVLNEFWGWSESDFDRELKQELLQQAVVAKLDTATTQKATAAEKQLQGGADFATLASQVSEDPVTKGNGGQYPAPITPNDPNLAPAVTQEIFNLKANQVSSPINTGYTLEIIKVLDAGATSRHAAHIEFIFQDVSTYIKPLEKQNPPKHYIKV